MKFSCELCPDDTITFIPTNDVTMSYDFEMLVEADDVSGHEGQKVLLMSLDDMKRLRDMIDDLVKGMEE